MNGTDDRLLAHLASRAVSPPARALGLWRGPGRKRDTREQAARDKAVAQLRKRRDFRGHLLVYVLVNGFLVVIWAITDPHAFFWPVFPIGMWGIAVIMNACDVHWRPQPTEEDIRREIEREDKPR